MTGVAQPRGTQAPVDTSWHEKARCNGADAKLFYHPEEERGSTRRARADAAKAICRACPVRLICREQSLASREQHGTWGGLSEDERSLLLAGKPIEGPLHDHPRPDPMVRRALGAPEPAPLVLTYAAPGRRVLVNDERVTTHVQALIKAGHTPKQIAAVAGMNTATIRTIASGRREVTERTANLLLALRSEAEVAA